MTSKNFFDTHVLIRLNEEQAKELDAFVSKNRNDYESRSHFIRSAIIKLLKEKQEVK